MPHVPRRRTVPALSLSVATHLLAVALLVLAFRHRPALLRPLRLPGTPQGQHLMLTYSLGGPAESKQSSLLHSSAVPPAPKKATHTSLKPAPSAPSAPMSETGSGSSGDSALGDENVRVALPQVHPRPQPDLSGLPHGTVGDVIVDVVIDDAGKVTATTLVKGLGSPIDTNVMQTLRDWTFTPATRNGQNIASEQEILIHYEHG